MRIGGALFVGFVQAAVLAVVPLAAGAPLTTPARLLLGLLCLAAVTEARVSRPDASAPPIMARVSALALLVDFWLALCVPGASALATAAGVGLVAGGIALRVAAIVALGDAFVSAHRASPLHADGIYRYLRHPSETGQLLLALGAATTTMSLSAAAWWAMVVLPLTLVRVRDEECQLCVSPAYIRYRAHVPAFFPRLPTISRRARRAV